MEFQLLPTLVTQMGSDSFFDVAWLNPLPQIHLFSNGRYVDQSRIEPGRYGIPRNEEITDLGPSIDILPVARRPQAMDFTCEPPAAVFDHESLEFDRIAERTQAPDSCMYGVSFLVLERSIRHFCEFYFGTKSLRGFAPRPLPFLPLTEAGFSGPLPLWQPVANCTAASNLAVFARRFRHQSRASVVCQESHFVL